MLAKQNNNTTVGSLQFPKKDDPRKLVALIFVTKIPEILKTRGTKAENVTKLEQVSCSQV